MDINYHNRKFRTLPDSPEDNSGTVFHYSQEGDIVTATFKATNILSGSLIAVMDDTGDLDIRYSYVNPDYDLVTGICRSTPTIMADGRIRLYERWQQTSGEMKKGHSIQEEISEEEEL